MASTVNTEQFKRALGTFPSGVTIVTTSYDNKLFGLTVTSFTSVSLLPPLILFCINKQAHSIKAFTSSQYFAVSILADNQTALSKHFAYPQLDKFASVLYHLGASSKCPLIDRAVCHIECNKFNQYSAGDHMIVIGEVVHTAVNDELKPLIYHRRS